MLSLTFWKDKFGSGLILRKNIRCHLIVILNGCVCVSVCVYVCACGSESEWKWVSEQCTQTMMNINTHIRACTNTYTYTNTHIHTRHERGVIEESLGNRGIHDGCVSECKPRIIPLILDCVCERERVWCVVIVVCMSMCMHTLQHDYKMVLSTQVSTTRTSHVYMDTHAHTKTHYSPIYIDPPTLNNQHYPECR
jgi:hypothetical protein